MKEWMKYVLIVVGTYVSAFLVYWALKHNTKELDELLLNSLALAIPLSISNCLLYKMNKVVNKTKKID